MEYDPVPDLVWSLADGVAGPGPSLLSDAGVGRVVLDVNQVGDTAAMVILRREHALVQLSLDQWVFRFLSGQWHFWGGSSEAPSAVPATDLAPSEYDIRTPVAEVGRLRVRRHPEGLRVAQPPGGSTWITAVFIRAAREVPVVGLGEYRKETRAHGVVTFVWPSDEPVPAPRALSL